MIKVACTGFPVGRKTYEAHFRTIELDALLKRRPRPGTVEKWRAQAPADFEFIVSAPSPVNRLSAADARHPAARSSGSDASLALQTARTLKAKLLVFRLPSATPPNPDVVQRLQRFFPMVPRLDLPFVWEPPSHWPKSLVADLSRQLHIVPALNPLRSPLKDLPTPFRYYRLSDRRSAPPFTEPELRAIRKACDRPLSYVVFDKGPISFVDAVRFTELI